VGAAKGKKEKKNLVVDPENLKKKQKFFRTKIWMI